MIDWPLDLNRIRRGSESNTFGMVRRRADGTAKPHQGWDFYAASGTPVFAVAAGKVLTVSDGGDYGLIIIHSFQHDGRTLYAVYAHMKSAAVKPGDSITCGQPIGLSGNSGNARTMKGEDQHLHFEVRTEQFPGRGLVGRLTPKTIFEVVPMLMAEKRKGPA